MPEGHTVHRAARLQLDLLGGRSLHVDSPQGRFAGEAALLDGRTLATIDVLGKHLFYEFEGSLWLHVHLGLYGKFRMGHGAPPAPRGAVRVRFMSERGWTTLSGPTACELIEAPLRRAIAARIGPDPLLASSRPSRALARISRSGVAIGALLMDQSVIGGIGNVYRAELLFRARLNPLTRGRDVPGPVVMAMWRDARRLMRDGERSGKIVTTRPGDRPHVRGAARPGEKYYTYHRAGKPCFVCGTAIQAAPLAGRTVYWCPSCQASPT